MQAPIHPRAMWLLMHMLRASYPRMTPEQVVSNAEKIIRGLQAGGYTVGPIAAFGPRNEEAAATPVKRDAFDGFDKLMSDMEERRPWAAPELS